MLNATVLTAEETLEKFSPCALIGLIASDVDTTLAVSDPDNPSASRHVLVADPENQSVVAVHYVYRDYPETKWKLDGLEILVMLAEAGDLPDHPVLNKWAEFGRKLRDALYDAPEGVLMSGDEEIAAIEYGCSLDKDEFVLLAPISVIEQAFVSEPVYA